MHLLYIGIFGGLGCVSRYFISNLTYQVLGRGLPYGTMIVNVAGSFLLALVMLLGMRSSIFPADVRMGITVGFMGGFTTFSTFSYETLRLLEDGSLWQAGANVVLNVMLCVAAALLGAVVARSMT